MTVAVACYDPETKQVAIGADRMVQSGWQTWARVKLHQVGEFWVAGTGVNVINNVFERLAAREKPPETVEELAREFFVEFEMCFGQVRTQRDHDHTYNTSFVVVKAGERPWFVCGDGSVTQPLEGYVTLGSGGEIAVGVCHILHRMCVHPETIVRSAMEACERHARGCGHGYDLKLLDPPEKS